MKMKNEISWVYGIVFTFYRIRWEPVLKGISDAGFRI